MRKVFQIDTKHKNFCCGTLVAILSFSTSLFGDERKEDLHPMHVTMRHIEAGGIGYNQGYTTLEGFFPLFRPFDCVWVPFLDFRGHLFNNGQPAANAGIGIRHLGSSCVLGGYAFYDYRKTNKQHYNQFSLGFESLGEIWDFRVNGYLPVGEKRSSLWDSHFEHFHGHFAFLSGKLEFALKGANAEAVAHITIKGKREIRVGAGPYYLSGHGEAAWGGEARVGIDLSQYCKLEGFTSYDSLFRWRGQGQISIVIPFGTKRKHPVKNSQSTFKSFALASRMVQPVDRFEIVPVDRKREIRRAARPSTGKPYFFWFVDNTSHSQGSFESPFSTLQAAQDVSVTGDVIYVFPGDGTSMGMDLGLKLKDNQCLLGAGVIHLLPTTNGLILIPPQATGLPNLTAPIGASIVNVANNNVVSGFQISSDANGIANGSYCIGSSSGTTRNLIVSKNILNANNGASGIVPSSPIGKITIFENVIQSTDKQGAYGIYAAQVNGRGIYEIENNLISNFQNHSFIMPDVPSGTGIVILAENQSRVRAMISGNQITECLAHGLDLRSFGAGTPFLSATVKNNQIEGILQTVGMFFLSDDSSSQTFYLLNNRTNECAFGIIAQPEGNSSISGWIQNNVLSNGPFGSGIVLTTNHTTNGSANGFFQMISNDISRFGDAQGIAIATSSTSSLTAYIKNNFLHEMGKAGIFSQVIGSSNAQLYIYNNNIFDNNGGIEAEPLDNAILNVILQKNTITGNNGSGFFANPEGQSSAKYEIISNVFTNNNLNNLNSGSAVTVITQDSSSACLRMLDNQSVMEATQPDYFLENTGSGQFDVEPLIGNTGSINQPGTTMVPPDFCD